MFHASFNIEINCSHECPCFAITFEISFQASEHGQTNFLVSYGTNASSTLPSICRSERMFHWIHRTFLHLFVQIGTHFETLIWIEEHFQDFQPLGEHLSTLYSICRQISTSHWSYPKFPIFYIQFEEYLRINSIVFVKCSKIYNPCRIDIPLTFKLCCNS